MRLKEFMTTRILTVSSQDTAESAYQIMQDNRIHHLLVMDGNRIVGVISDRDLGRDKIRQYAFTGGLLVEDFMEEDVVVANPDMTVKEAANLMRGRKINCLPVLDGGKLMGIITTTDLLDLLGQGIERITGETEKRGVTRENPGKKQASFNPALGR